MRANRGWLLTSNLGKNMKKILVLIILVIGIAFFQFNKNSLKEAEKFARIGNYKAFYQSIEKKLKQDKNAKNLLINYCFKAIQEGNIEEVSFYLQKKPQLVNMIDDERNRAIDIVLFGEKINIDMLQLLLKYNPQLNYIIKYYDMTPLQVVVTEKYDYITAIKLLLEHGADINYVGYSNRSKNTPLRLSFVADKLKVFSFLLNNKAEPILPSNNVYNDIASSYAMYLDNNGVDLHNFYDKKLSKDTISLLHSVGYKILHKKNMQYIKLLIDRNKKNGRELCEITHLMKWYIKAQQNQALITLLKGKVCLRTLYKMRQFAIKQNNRPALYIKQ